MNRNLLILGTEAYSAVAREIAEAEGRFEKIAFLDGLSDDAKEALADLKQLAGTYHYAVAAVEAPAVRLRLIQRLLEDGYEVTSLVHPAALVASSATLSMGCIVEPRAVISPEATLGVGTLVGAGSLVGHHCVVGAACQLDLGSIIEANAVVPMGTKVAAGQVFQGKELLLQDGQGTTYRVAQYDAEEEWVQQHIREFGTAPSFS